MSAKNLPKSHFGFAALLGVIVATALISITATVFILSSTGALAFTPSDLLSGIGQIKRSTWDNLTRGFALWVLPQGHSWGLDADSVDGLHAASFALSKDLDSFSSLTSGKLSSLSRELSSLGTSLSTGELAAFFQNASNLVSGTISDSRLSSNVALLNSTQTFTGPKTFSSGTLTVAAGTTLSLSKGSLLDVQGSLSLPPGSITTVDLADSSVTSLKILDGTIVNADISSSASIAYSKLNLGGSITGSDLSPSIAITTSGAISAGGGVSSSSSLTTTGSGTLSIAGASTLSSSLSVLGASTLAGTTVASLTTTTGVFSSTVPDGATAVAFDLATSTAYATAGANLLVLKNNTTTELSLDKNGNLTVNGNLIATGTLQGTQLISTVATGTAPLVVSSTTQVANLNSNFLQGYQASDLYSSPQPNLIPNSDFSRRTKWMTFMPETFADTSGWTLDSGTMGSVASNSLTPGSGNWQIHAGLSTWKDVRMSAQFQLVTNDANLTSLAKQADTNNLIRASYAGGATSTFYLVKVVGGSATILNSVAFSATQGNWYWLELEAQGTTYIAKMYSCGASACAKSSATLITGGTLTATGSDSAYASGNIGLLSQGGSNVKFGGLSTGDGGVYVEGWGPESFQWDSYGTKGGQGFGIDETADAGAIGKQFALRAFIPAATRTFDIATLANIGLIQVGPTTSYTLSGYFKTSGKGGTGALLELLLGWYDSGKNFISYATAIDDAAETAWTRKSSTYTSPSNARYAAIVWRVNPTSTATGTAFLDLAQLEQGSVATPWRNAPEDLGPLRWRLALTSSGNIAMTSASLTEVDSRDLGINLFAPWDGTLSYIMSGSFNQGGGTGSQQVQADASLDGSQISPQGVSFLNIGVPQSVWWAFTDQNEGPIAAGKHRLAWRLANMNATQTLISRSTPGAYLMVTLTRGK